MPPESESHKRHKDVDVEDATPSGKSPAFPSTPAHLCASLFLFGLAQLLPWNLYIKSIPYWRFRLLGTVYSASVAGYVTSSFTLANLVTMLVLVLARWDELVLDTRGRILVGMLINALLMVFMTMVPVFNPPQAGLFTMVIICSSLAGSATGFLVKGLLGMMSQFPPVLTPWLLAGQAAAGLLVSIATMISTISGAVNRDSPLGPILYFVVGTLTMLISIFVLAANCRWSLPFRYYMRLGVQGRGGDQGHAISKRPHASFSVVMRVLGRIRWFALGIGLTLMVSISIYATFITAPRADVGGIGPTISRFYVPVIFIIYDLGDLIGRWILTIDALGLHYKSRILKILPWTRLLVFFPVFFIIAPVDVTSRKGHQPVLTLSFGWIDIAYAIVIFALSMSNGYCCTSLIMHAPSKAISNPHYRSNEPSVGQDGDALMTAAMEKGTCGSLMGLFINIGLVVGSLSTFFWRLIL